VIKHTLGESLARRLRAQVAIETEGLHDRQVSLDSEHWRSRPLLLAEHLSTPLVEGTVDTTDGGFGALNFD
jgi:hypothetical protein